MDIKSWIVFLLAGTLIGSLTYLAGPDLLTEESHWGYQADVGPNHWGELSPSYYNCIEGHTQSPIDIQLKECDRASGKTSLHFHYVPSVLDIVNNGHTEQVNCLTDNEVEESGKHYHLAQFHFHAPSEHTLEGRSYPMEIHFVHQSETGELLVIGLLVQEGKRNEQFTCILDHLPRQTGEHDIVPVPVDILGLFPDHYEAYQYEGSLTTPPCSEGVHWYVIAEPIEMDHEQIAAFQALYPHNNRPTQPLYDRSVQQITE